MRIAFIGDQKGKVHHYRCKIFQRYIPEYHFDFYTAANNRLESICRKYDAVYYASFTLYLRRKVRHRNLYGSATSWKCIIDKNGRRMLKRLKKFKGLSANNLALAKKLQKYRRDIQYLPNGVDVDFFHPPDERAYNPDRPAIGWVGNSNRREKNFFTVFAPVNRKAKRMVKMKVIATNKSSSHKRLKSHKQMLRYYRGINFYLVTSSYEGTPNPALEAAACGVPVITTRVGNMPQLIRDGKNGFFVEPNYASIMEKLKSLQNISEAEYQGMSREIRENVVRDWSWEDKCKGFAKFFGASS